MSSSEQGNTAYKPYNASSVDRVLLSTEKRSAVGVAMHDLFEGWRLKRLWFRLGYTEVRRRYRRTILGPFWATGHIFVYILCVGYIFGTVLQKDQAQYFTYLTTGIIAWMLVYNIMQEASGSFTGNTSIRQQQAYPYSMFVFTLLSRNLIVHAHNYVLYLWVNVMFGSIVSWNLLWLIPGYILMCINLTWISILVATLGARYRDVQQLIATLIQVMVFVTPIFYTIDKLTEFQQKYILMPNLLYHLTVVIRAPLMGQMAPLSSYYILIFTAIFGSFLTAWYFGKNRRNIVYWIM